MTELRPAVAALALWALAFLALAATIIGLGLLLTHVLLPAGLDQADPSWSGWFVSQRTPALDDATGIGSTLGSTAVILVVAGAVGLGLVIARRLVQFVFLLFAMTLESAVFLMTTLVVGRNRPDASQLDAAPPTSSYPSGHTAASCTLAIGLAIVLTSFVHGTVARAVVWALAVLVPAVVGLSRVYRGMHYPSDVLAGVLLAAGALVLALLAVRSLTAAQRERPRRDQPEDRGAANSASLANTEPEAQP
jgi:undecaprenyl-diphosphatase